MGMTLIGGRERRKEGEEREAEGVELGLTQAKGARDGEHLL
jgi:hypothetical protein